MKYLNIENFEQVTKENNKVLIDFYADWCGPCRMIAPFLEEVQEETGVEIFKVNIDESPNIASECGVMSIPTLIIFKKGEKVSANVGAASKARILDWVKAHQ